MSVKLRSPVVVRRSTRAVRLEESPCWEGSVCSGDQLMRDHASRISWWIAIGLVVVALALVGVIMQHAYVMQGTAPTSGVWSASSASSWIQPTPRALASLVGIAIVLDLYTSYMMAMKKGHLDRYVGQFILGSFLRTGLWLLFLHGLAYGGTIGSMFALVSLALLHGWGFMTSHALAPFHSWLGMMQLAFVIFLIVWLSMTGAKVYPTF